MGVPEFYKNLPKASYDHLSIPPRERIIPEGQEPGEPKVLSVEDAMRLREKHVRKSAEWSTRKDSPSNKKIDPWAKCRPRRK